MGTGDARPKRGAILDGILEEGLPYTLLHYMGWFYTLLHYMGWYTYDLSLSDWCFVGRVFHHKVPHPLE